ncbi:MAG: lipopolysaccharide biosynthesis protein [Candidatus Kapaibacterium sp.]
MSSKIARLASDTVVYGISTVLSRFLTFLLTPLFTNNLSKTEIGEVAAIYAMIAFVNILYSLGMEPAFMRFWHKDDGDGNHQVFTTAFSTVTVLSVVVTLATILLAAPIASSPMLALRGQGAHLVQIAALIPLLDGLVLIPFAQLRMQQRPRVFATLRLLSVVVTFAFTLLFVVAFGWRIEGALWAGVIGSATTFLVFLPGIVRTVRSTVSSVPGLLRQMLSFGLPTVPSNFSSIMVQVADRPIMLMLTSSSVVGMYQTNFRLALPMMMFVTVFEYAWKPFYLNHRQDEDAKQTFATVFTAFTAVCGAIFLVTSLFIEYVVQLPFIGGRFVNPEYWEGLTIIPIVMFAYFFNGVFINMAAGLHIEKRTGFFPVATVTAAIVSVAATWLLVPPYGIMGAAWAKVLAYVVSAVMLYEFSQRVYPIRYEWGKVAMLASLTAIAYLGVMSAQLEGNVAITIRVATVAVYSSAAFLILGGQRSSIKGLFRR